VIAAIVIVIVLNSTSPRTAFYAFALLFGAVAGAFWLIKGIMRVDDDINQ